MLYTCKPWYFRSCVKRAGGSAAVVANSNKCCDVRVLRNHVVMGNGCWKQLDQTNRQTVSHSQTETYSLRNRDTQLSETRQTDMIETDRVSQTDRDRRTDCQRAASGYCLLQKGRWLLRSLQVMLCKYFCTLCQSTKGRPSREKPP